MSDGLGCFPGVTEADCTHTPIPTGGGAPSEGHPIFWWINTMLGNVKNAMHGTYHALRPKYLQRYLSEFCYRFVHSLFLISAEVKLESQPMRRVGVTLQPPPQRSRSWP